MDQYLNNRQNEILWELLANPADNGQLHNYDLQQLVDEFPQSGILRAMLAHAGVDLRVRGRGSKRENDRQNDGWRHCTTRRGFPAGERAQATATGPGFGYRIEEIQRVLPEPAAVEGG